MDVKFASGFKETFSGNFWASAKIGSGSTKAALRRILIGTDQVGWNNREESGRLDRRAFGRFAVGEKSVFSRREHKEAEKSACLILVDTSYSTTINLQGSTRRIDALSAIASSLAYLLDQCGAAVQVDAFKGETSEDLEKVKIVELKSFDESLRSSAEAIGSLPFLSDSSTPDFGAVYEELQLLSRRPEQRKILFLLTDADDFNVKHHQHVQRLADKLRVTIVAVAVGGKRIVECYRHAASVSSADELYSGVFSKLLAALKSV